MSDAAIGSGAAPRIPCPHRGLLVAVLSSLAAALLATAVAIAIFAAFAAGERSNAPTAAAPPEWLDVSRPVHIFSLEAPMLARLPLVYSARRRSAGDGREDMLAFGTLGEDAPALRLRLFRRAEAGSTPAPLFAAIARQASEAGLSVERAGLADLLPTRFGAFEIAEVMLTDGGARHVPCRGFRLVLSAPAFTTAGLVCGAADQPVERAALACMIDRLDLASGGEDHAMIEFFSKSELRRDARCGGARVAPDTLHAVGLDDKPATPRRTSRRH